MFKEFYLSWNSFYFGRIYKLSNDNELIRSIKTYDRLLNKSYYFVIGRKNKAVEIHLQFSKKEFFHLSGLQYITDIPFLKSDREKVYDKIYSDSRFREKILNSDNYSKIKERVELVANMEFFLDSNKTIFKYNNHTNSSSSIQADFILKNEDISKFMYVFISKIINTSNSYCCRSSFPRNKDKCDLAKGHTSFTLLHKEKTNIQTGEIQVLFSSPLYKKI